MQTFCGTDIIEISRIKESIEKTGDKFINKIYTLAEIEYCESKNNVKYQHYAARFASKEAVFKAISTLNINGISWKDIEIKNDNIGKPYVSILNKNIEKLQNIDLSISHCKEYAVAVAIAIIGE
jgi:holo-[acyl-carrier protein] synthase